MLWLSTSRRHRRARSHGSERAVVRIARYGAVVTDPPRMFWAPCSPSTTPKFKASVTCPNGHTLTLRNHAVMASGYVIPSVVCPTPGCKFHEFVYLDQWDSGDIV
jgi:hypothetical protein